MKPKHCPRMWEAEALVDAKLDDVSKASFERHVASCEICNREVADLAAVDETMRRLPVLPLAPLEHRRMRIALLDRGAATIERQRWPKGSVWALMGSMAAAAVVVILVHHGGVGPVNVVPSRTVSALPAPPVFEISDITHADWTSKADGSVLSGSLRSGAAAFHVQHLTPAQRFVVSLPDGELEVRGTRFVVDVRDERTQRVQVTEGAVALRIRGQSEAILLAGDQWLRREGPSETPLQQGGPVLAPVRAAAQGWRSGLAPARMAPPARSGATRLVDTPQAANASNDVGSQMSERFSRAMAAFQTGSYAQADGLLASFGRDYPKESLAEDAAFLRILARQRLGDRDGAASLSRAYLLGYPQGFRRLEAQRVLVEPARSPLVGSALPGNAQ